MAAFLLLTAVVGPVAAAEPDPILAGPASGPCARQAAGADYVAGTDAVGNPVASAEGPGAEPAPGGGRVLLTVPRRQDGGEVSVPVDLAALAPPACKPAPPPHSPR